MGAPKFIRTYDDYVEVCRSRAVGLKTTRLQIDEVAGLPVGYSSKLLSKLRHFGPMSFDAVNGALGLMFIAVDDPAALARIRSRYGRKSRTSRAEARAYGDGLLPLDDSKCVAHDDGSADDGSKDGDTHGGHK